VIQLLATSLPIAPEIIKNALTDITLAGRIQIVNNPITTIFDVSHNPAAVLHLANYLSDHPIDGKTIAVFSMLADKDIAESVRRIKMAIDEWWVAPLQDKRGASIDTLSGILTKEEVQYHSVNAIKFAYQKAKEHAGMADRIVVFGSFHTVKEALQGIDTDYNL
jgi:dihydrofolate synthase/folylpolyglutamate synthase